jgi:hypothetical protein
VRAGPIRQYARIRETSAALSVCCDEIRVAEPTVRFLPVLLTTGPEVARHPRSYGTGIFVFEKRHYFALIETKPNALDQAAPLRGWELP